MAPHARSCCGEPQGSQQGPRGYGGAPFSPILLPQDLNSLTWRCLVEGFGPTDSSLCLPHPKSEAGSLLLEAVPGPRTPHGRGAGGCLAAQHLGNLLQNLSGTHLGSANLGNRNLL